MLSGAYLLSSTNSHKIMNFMVRIFCSRLLLMTRFKCPDIKVSLLVTMVVIMSLRKKKGGGVQIYDIWVFDAIYCLCYLLLSTNSLYWSHKILTNQWSEYFAQLLLGTRFRSPDIKFSLLALCWSLCLMNERDRSWCKFEEKPCIWMNMNLMFVCRLWNFSSESWKLNLAFIVKWTCSFLLIPSPNAHIVKRV